MNRCIFSSYSKLLVGRKIIFQSQDNWLCKHFSSENKLESPLSGVKIIDLTRIVAGPFCTMVLGDLGAEVYKIEQPGSGDEARKWGPPFIENSDMTCYFVCLNRNKKSVCVNFKTPEGIKVIHDLAKISDVLVENFVPGKLNSLGIGYDDLKTYAPQLIYLSLTGYGSRGPYSPRPGYDVIAASIGGLLDITGPEGGDPCKPGVAMTDLTTGLFAHGAILAALLQRNKTGLGQKIDCNLLSTQVAALINIGSNYLNAGKEAKRWGTAHESIVPYESFATADGFLTVGAGSDLQFKSLCNRTQMFHLMEDPRFIDNKSRVKNRTALIQELRKCFATKTTSEWLESLEGASFPYGQVNKVSQVFRDQHVRAVGLVQSVQLADGAHAQVVGPPVEYSASRNTVRSPPPGLGQHTDQDLPTLRLRLKKPKSKKQVKWGKDTVDNEHMNKKKSKCCCIYNKPKAFGESSSESDDECDNCQGHVEKRKKNQSESPSQPGPSPGNSPPSLVPA